MLKNNISAEVLVRLYNYQHSQNILKLNDFGNYINSFSPYRNDRVKLL